MDITIIEEVSEEIVEAFSHLMPQLSPDTPPPTHQQLQEIIHAEGTYLFAAQKNDAGHQVIGFLTLIIYRVPSGVLAKIEDVIVDMAFRKRGIGEKLLRAAMLKAEGLGAKSISLTSRPSREAANRLYQRLGFTQPDTNLYRYYPKK